MDVIPVIDLMGGLAVHAVRGERKSYLPARSVLAASADPVELALAMQAETGAPAVYAADLDAIVEGRGNRDVLRAMARALPCELWVDAGVTGAAGPDGALDALRVLEAGAARVIAGTESLASLDALEAIGREAGWDKVIVSLDVKGGRTLSKARELAGAPPLESLDRLAATGCPAFILLTLDGVGAGKGPDWPLLEPARKRLTGAALYAGGGTRDMDDVRRATAMGLDGVLVGTALHRGLITAATLGREI